MKVKELIERLNELSDEEKEFEVCYVNYPDENKTLEDVTDIDFMDDDILLLRPFYVNNKNTDEIWIS